MIVVGGTYREICTSPQWAGLRGSGARAALALSDLCHSLQLYTYAHTAWLPDLYATLSPRGVDVQATPISEELVFEYWHPLWREYGSPALEGEHRHPDFAVEGDVVLAFGMLESGVRLKARKVVYDPRSANLSASFTKVGVAVGQLAYVIQHADLMALWSLPEPADPRDAATRLMKEEDAALVVARHPFGRATVYIGDAQGIEIPCYDASRWFKIGEGDIFCAAFAYWWGVQGYDAVRAADLASRSVAYYNDGPDRFLPADQQLAALVPVPRPNKKWTVFLSGPRVTVAEIWMFEDTVQALRSLGANVITDFPSMGMEAMPGSDRKNGGNAGLVALLALGDTRYAPTNVHVGYAMARGIPVVILVEGHPDYSDSVVEEGRCEVVRDHATAVYRACLACWRPTRDAEAAA